MAKNNAIDIDIETGGGNTYTFPSATSTLATLALAETLTNKNLSAASNTLGSANVADAGALMDSEVTNLTQVKAFDSSDYATAAQGSKADSAVQDTGDETIAGIKTFSSSPIVPAPTTDLQAATKKYVDDNGGAEAFTDLGDKSSNFTIDASTGSKFKVTLTTTGIDIDFSNLTEGQEIDIYFGNSVQDTYDVSTLTYSTLISTQDNDLGDLVFNDTGSKLYEAGIDNGNIYEYDLSTPFDLSTATLSQTVSPLQSKPFGILWNDDGTKLYILEGYDGIVYEYDISTPYDPSTASFSTSLSMQDGAPRSIAWNDDGTKLYEGGAIDEKIFEYDLTTAYDLSTATYSQSGNVGDQPNGLAWNDDGTKVYICSSALIREYDASTAFDVSTLSSNQSATLREDYVAGIQWNNDGSKLYSIHGNPDQIIEYDVGTKILNIPNSIAQAQYFNGESLPASVTNKNLSVVELVWDGVKFIGSYKELE